MRLADWNSPCEQTLVVTTQDSVSMLETIGGNAPSSVSQMTTASGARLAGAVVLSDVDRALLRRWAQSRTSPARLVLRSRVVLLAADGSSTTGIARRLGTTIKTVVLWRRRFVAGGVGALEKDASGRGRKRAISLELLERVRSGLQAGRGVREVARSVGISPASVVRQRDRGR
jgi:hypothetical protein